ncbi:VOC family protein [Accumulibacter sp.]|uniref:VOC family protein n=1 Tax=Accumulibacter sp. TaxID=2053492 RepID=UPI0028C3C458|nr:VOC family protein [Accumulibacter sp.]
MASQIFVNLPVADLQRSVGFFTALGFSFNPQWTDDSATCMIIDDNIFVMLLTRERFQSFTPKPVADATKSTEVLVCLSRASRAAVDETVSRAVANGGSTWKPAEDHGFMYGHAFQDPDGHIWELIHMTQAA